MTAPRDDIATPPPHLARSTNRRDAAIVVLLAAVLFIPALWTSGLAMTEGHRAIPGWTMLTDSVAPHVGPARVVLYEADYTRKPPGMPWLIALSSVFLGPTAFAARLVSAASITLAALWTLRVTRDWFPPPHHDDNDAPPARAHAASLAAAIAALLSPMLWPVARAAEIEGPLVLAIALAALGLTDTTLQLAAGRRAKPTVLAATVLGVFLAIVTKGPAGLFVLPAAVAGALIAARTLRPLRSPHLYLPPLIGGAAALLALIPFFHQRSLPGAITEDVSHFLWRSDALADIALLPLAAFAAALPASLGLLFCWGPDAVREAEHSAADATARRAALALSTAWILAIAAITVAGVSNPRYAMPAVVLVWPLAGYVVRNLQLHVFTPKRAAIARTLTIGRPVVLAVILAIAGVAFGFWHESRRARISGEPAGQAVLARIQRDLDAVITPGEPDTHALEHAIILADAAVEARPEILLPLARAGARVVWHKPGVTTSPVTADVLRTTPVYLVLRRDDSSDEADTVPPTAWLALSADNEPPAQPTTIELTQARAHKFNVVLFRLAPPRDR